MERLECPAPHPTSYPWTQDLLQYFCLPRASLWSPIWHGYGKLRIFMWWRVTQKDAVEGWGWRKRNREGRALWPPVPDLFVYPTWICWLQTMCQTPIVATEESKTQSYMDFMCYGEVRDTAGAPHPGSPRSPCSLMAHPAWTQQRVCPLSHITWWDDSLCRWAEWD